MATTRVSHRRGLAGARIGVPRASFCENQRHGPALRDAMPFFGTTARPSFDPADIARQPPPVPGRRRSERQGTELFASKIVFKYGMTRLQSWLSRRSGHPPDQDVDGTAQWNLAHRAPTVHSNMARRSSQFRRSDLERDRVRYVSGIERQTYGLTVAEGSMRYEAERLDHCCFRDRPVRLWPQSRDIRR